MSKIKFSFSLNIFYLVKHSKKDDTSLSDLDRLLLNLQYSTNYLLSIQLYSLEYYTN